MHDFKSAPSSFHDYHAKTNDLFLAKIVHNLNAFIANGVVYIMSRLLFVEPL